MKPGLVRFFWLFASSILLAACAPILSSDTRVTFRVGEAWEAQVEVVFAPEQVQRVGSQIDQALDQLVSDLSAQNIEAEWQQRDPDENGNIPYRVTAQGQGLEQLNQSFFDNQAVLYLDEASGYVVFRYYPGSAVLSGVQQQTFTLVGGRVISSNGLQSNANTVTWTNPQVAMEAVLTEAPRYPWLPYALIGSGGILLTVAIIGIVRLRQVPSTAPVVSTAVPELRPAIPTPTFCAACGAVLPVESAFCPVCGTKRPAP